MEDYWGEGKASKPMLPSIGVPTTAGTGSEAQSFALIAQEGTHQKNGVRRQKSPISNRYSRSGFDNKRPKTHSGGGRH